MTITDAIGWALLLIGVGAVVGYLLAWWRGAGVYRHHLQEHIAGFEAFHQASLDELAAENERLRRENRNYERTLVEYTEEITGLHHALDAQAEANVLADQEERDAKAARRRASRRRLPDLEAQERGTDSGFLTH